MRASRAYIAGVGTTGVLVASAVLLLAVVSTLVAFQGWPGTDLKDDVSSLTVDGPKRLAVDGPVQVARNAAPAAAAVADAPVPGTPASGRPATVPAADISTSSAPELPSGPGPDGTADQGPNISDDDPIPTSVDPDVGPPGLLLPDTPLSPQVRRVTDGLGDATQGLTDDLGNRVGAVNPQLGQTVTETGRILADLLRGLGRPR
jgi:hypothetical protein